MQIACINCKNVFEFTEKAIFCPVCMTQNKCKECGSDLVLGARGCIYCGASIIEKVTSNQDLPVNTIEYEQKADFKKMKAVFTNNIGEQLVHSLQGLFSMPSGRNAVSNPFVSNKTIGASSVANKVSSNKKDFFDDAEVIDQDSEGKLNQALAQIFKIENDKLIIINSRLKQTGKRDHAIRLALLSLYACSLTEKKQLPKTDFNEILEHAKLNDGNFRSWLAQCDEITKLTSGNLELSMPGIDAAKGILREFIDSNIEKGSIVFSHLSSSGKSKKLKKTTTNESDDRESVSKTKNTGKESPVSLIQKLLKDGYFAKRRKIGEIVSYLKDDKATIVKNSSIATVLARLVKDSKIKREKNGEEQYEYFQ